MGFLGPKYDCSDGLQILRLEKQFVQKNWSDVRHRNRMTNCLYIIKKSQLVEHYIVVITDLLFIWYGNM